MPEGAPPTVYRAVGCAACGNSGYRGRTGIYEVLRVTPAVEDLILSRASAQAVRTLARREGMLTLRQAGWQKALAGDTSLAEIFDHTLAHDHAAAS